jgi:CMP/dCMP kinase
MVIAIDGPAGAGKSTVARGVAERLGFTYLDSCAMYRAAALAALGRGERTPAEIAAAMNIELGERVLVDGTDVTDAIRSPMVSEAASKIATDAAVREALVAKQKELMQHGDWVAEGRDIGTVVKPDAEVKVWLTASPQERAERRGIPVGELAERDARDAERDHAPMIPAADAVAIDTTGLSVDEVVARIVGLA